MEPRFATRAIEASNDRQWATDGAAACGTIVILSSIIRVLGKGSSGTTTTASGGAPTVTRFGVATRDLTCFATGVTGTLASDRPYSDGCHLPNGRSPVGWLLDLPRSDAQTSSSLPALEAPTERNSDATHETSGIWLRTLIEDAHAGPRAHELVMATPCGFAPQGGNPATKSHDDSSSNLRGRSIRAGRVGNALLYGCCKAVNHHLTTHDASSSKLAPGQGLEP